MDLTIDEAARAATSELHSRIVRFGDGPQMVQFPNEHEFQAIIARHMTALVAERDVKIEQLLQSRATAEIMRISVCHLLDSAGVPEGGSLETRVKWLIERIATLEAEVKPMLTEGFKEVQDAVMGDNLRLRSANKELRAMLGEIQYRGHNAVCPECRKNKYVGHIMGCRLAELLSTSDAGKEST